MNPESQATGDQSTFHQRYHEVQKESVAANHVNLKAFWSRINEEMTTHSKDDSGVVINEAKLQAAMANELAAVAPTMVVSNNSIKVLSKACEMFILDLTIRACQANLDGGNVLREEDVIQAIRTSEIHDIFMP